MQFKIMLLLGLFVFGNSYPVSSCSAIESPWDVERLFQTPQWEKTQVAAKPGMTGLLYDAIPLRDKRVQVFAYYSTPEGKPPAGGWPAMVCVHGGGGTAFDTWVTKWNDHGYAAISMDLEGHYPIRKAADDQRGPRLSTENPGLSRLGVFKNYQDPIKDQWYFHAVAQAIQAHSLIRSFPEINAGKIGITGISWGGTLTSTIMGVDSRFKFAIPVYGCGFLPDSDGHQGQTITPGTQSDFVNANFDGSAFFENVTVPTLWVNGTNDKHFPMPSTQQSAQSVKGPATIRFELEMKHGHGPGWQPAEIYAFADSIVKDAPPLTKLSQPKIEGNQVTASFSSASKVAKAELLFTRESGLWPKRKWEAAPALLTDSKVSSTVPEGATALFFNLTDERKLMVSSEFVQMATQDQDTQSPSSSNDASQIQTKDHYPKFSWDTVPVGFHFGKNGSLMTADEAKFVASRASFICLEKAHASSQFKFTEDAIQQEAQQLKKLNPELKVIFYWNTFLDYPMFRAHLDYQQHPDWWLKTAAGALDKKKGDLKRYDLSLPEVRNWWTDVAQQAVVKGSCDGVFMDAFPQIKASGNKKLWGQKKYDDIQKGLVQVIQETRAKIGDDKLIFFNGIRNTPNMKIGNNFAQDTDAVMIEHFGHFNSSSKECMLEDIQAMIQSGKQGKIVVFKAWPGFAWGEKTAMRMPLKEKRAMAGKNITFPLAAFLVGAQEHAYFIYNWGYRMEYGCLEWYPELDKPLGEPQGDMTRDQWTLKRQFKHASVSVNLETKEADIQWH